MSKYVSYHARWLAPQGVFIAAALLSAANSGVAIAQQASEGMIIRRVEIKGLTTISEGFIRRTVKTRETQPLSVAQLQEDVRELLRTRKFLNAFADTSVEEGQAVVVFTIQEKPEIATIEFEGNKRFTTNELAGELSFSTPAPLDMFAVNKGRDDILRKYKEKGYYYATVEVDQRALRSENRVVYRITEGPRVRVRRIAFEGNRSFPNARLRAKIQTRTYIWIIRTGEFDQERADRDAVDLQAFYREQGYLDARCGYRLEFDEVDRTNLTIVFLIEEGVRYRVKEIQFNGNSTFDTDRLAATIDFKPGDLMIEERRAAAVKAVQDAYGTVGYVDARVETALAFIEEAGEVTLRFDIVENKPSKFGAITIRGNAKTKDEVVRRELKFYPGEDYNTVKAREAEKRITDTGLFSRATVSPLEDMDGFREALVEVEEAQTINFLIGGGISTDNGVIGTLTIENRNFDLFDWPRTWGEFFRGRAFRGDGQRMRIQLEPGSEVSRFRIDFEEPYLFDKPVYLGLSTYLFQRARDSYDEQRLGFIPSVGKRFESGLLEGWAIEGSLRVEGIDIDNLSTFPSRQIRDVKGGSLLTSVKGSIVRDTTDSRLLPSKGYRAVLAWEQVGALGGDYDFGRPSASFTWYKTVRTDIFDRKSILAVKGDIGYITGDAPVFERFYGGGLGSIRGFDYRGVSPRAGVFENRVGGDFILLTGAEYSFPLYEDTLRGVAFVDMGTVEDEFGITDWRASVGFGFRIQVPFFGPVPFVFDFGFPILEGDDDDNRVFSFSVGGAF